MNKRVAIFTNFGQDMISSPMINSAEYLAAAGYVVDIFARNPIKGFAVPVFRHKMIQYYVTEIPLSRIGWRIARVRLLINTWRKMRQHRYDFVIGFDPWAFQHAWLLAKIFKIPAFHHSLEFFWPENSLRKKINSACKMFFLHRADWMITQDAMRADWLSDKCRFPRKKISVVYNSSLGDCLPPRKSRYFRDKFGIADDKTIVLAVGTLDEHTLARQVAESVYRWGPEFILVFHGWGDIGIIRAVADRYPGRIFVSTELLPIERKYEVFQAADIGLVMFTNDNDNCRLVGRSTGKLFEFTRCGVPVIANETTGMRELIDGRCGEICGPRLEGIENALQIVRKNYDAYVRGCNDFYAAHSFAECYRRFLERVNTL